MDECLRLNLNFIHTNVLYIRFHRKYYGQAFPSNRTSVEISVKTSSKTPDINVIVIKGSGEKAFCAGESLAGFLLSLLCLRPVSNVR